MHVPLHTSKYTFHPYSHLMLRIEPRALCTRDKHSSTKLYPMMLSFLFVCLLACYLERLLLHSSGWPQMCDSPPLSASWMNWVLWIMPDQFEHLLKERQQLVTLLCFSIQMVLWDFFLKAVHSTPNQKTTWYLNTQLKDFFKKIEPLVKEAWILFSIQKVVSSRHLCSVETTLSWGHRTWTPRMA